MDFQALRAELLNDPVGLGYVTQTQTDTQAAATLNSLTTGRTVQRRAVPPNDVLGAILAADLNALTTNQLLQLTLILHAAASTGVDASNTNIRGVFTTIFATKTTTLNALAALATQTVSRAVELGLGTVQVNDVTIARSGKW